MALSNWDCMALDENSQPTDGTFKINDRFSISIYKNWLYVHDGNDAIATITEGSFSATIAEGTFSIAQCHIYAKRGPSDGIYVVAHYCEYPTSEEDPSQHDYAHPIHHVMVGCGIYGYSYDIDDQSDPYYGTFYVFEDGSRELLWSSRDIHNELIIDPEVKATFIAEHNEEHPDAKIVNIDIQNLGTSHFTGVQEEHINFLSAFYKELDITGVQIDFSKAVRFNPGDMFFATQLNKPELLQATLVGEASEPVINQVYLSGGQ